MDPLSVAANIIAVINAASSASEVLRRLFELKYAPEEILQYLNEISDIQAVVTILNNVFSTLVESPGTDIKIMDHLQQLLLGAKKILLELNEILEKKLMNRMFWLRNQSRLKRLLASLRDTRLQINMTLTTITATETPHTRIRLNEVAMQSTQILDSVQRYEKSSGKQIDALVQTVSQLQLSLSVYQKDVRREKHTSSYRNYPPSPPLRIQTSLFDSKSCGRACACNCHKTTRFMIPNRLQAIVGSLLIGYSGLPGNLCNEKICRRQDKRVLTLNYYFPRWFVYQRLISFRDDWSPTQGHAISIKTPRTVDRSTTMVFDMATDGNLEGLQRLFSQGLASPFDVNGSNRYDSVLFYCLTGSFINMEMCELLLNEGADPNLENQMGFSPVDYVWNLSILKPNNLKMKAVTDLFSRYTDLEESLQRRNFSIFHKIVLGLSDVDLRSQLQTSTADIDHQDSIGRTALHWAASMPGTTHLETLIEFGATLHLQNVWGATPLHQACLAGSLESVESLLQAARSNPPKAWASGPSSMLQEVVSYVSGKPNSLDSMNSYLKFFLEQRLHAGTTALFDACLRPEYSYEKVKLLLDYGADMDLPDSDTLLKPLSSTPLLYSVQANKHDVLRLLLERGARTDVKDVQNMSVLHLAGYDGDIETITILNLKRADGTKFYSQNDVDAFGNTPLQAFDIGRLADHPSEDEFMRQRCRKVFLQLLGLSDYDIVEIKDSSDLSVDLHEEDKDLFFDVEQNPEDLIPI